MFLQENRAFGSGSKLVGNKGENLACEYLVEKGFVILGRNYEIPFGEIDIICRKRWELLKFLTSKNDKTIHFVEVKTSFLSGDSFFPENRVNYSKQHKLRRLAEIWLSKNSLPYNTPHQIDIIAVSLNPKPEIKFFENVISDQNLT